MSYQFVKRYNEAYDFFLTRYFREHGIQFDEKTSFEEVDVRTKFGCKNPKEMSPEDDLFCAYVRSWGSHPESRPALSHLLSHALGGDGGVSLQMMRKLENELPKERGKLIFSEKETATDIALFYKRYMTDALRRDLKNGVTGPGIWKYFSRIEMKQLPDVRDVGTDKLYELTQGKAVEFLRWLEAIDSEKILLDMRQVLEEHLKGKEHMRPLDLSIHGDPRPAKNCYHDSIYVKLAGFYREEDNYQSISINPERGFRVWEKRKWEDDWSMIIFLEYYVFREE